MGVTWSAYKEKRKKKKELERFVIGCNSFIVSILWKKEKKLEHPSYAVEKRKLN